MRAMRCPGRFHVLSLRLLRLKDKRPRVPRIASLLLGRPRRKCIRTSTISLQQSRSMRRVG